MDRCRRVAGGWGAWVVVGVALAVTRPASAGTGVSADPPPVAVHAAPARTKIALLDMKAADPKLVHLVAGLSAVVAQVFSGAASLQVLTSSDIRTMLGFEAQRQLLGCTDSSCLAQIGGALGVKYVVSPELARVGRTYLVTVTVLDVADAAAAARDTERTTDEDGLIDAATRAARAARRKVVGTPVVRAAPAAATETSGGRGVLAWSLTGTGGAAVVAGGILLASAWATYGAFQDGQKSGGTPTVTYPQAQSAEMRATLGVAVLSVGAAALVSSFLVPHPRAAPAVGVALVPGGGYADVTIPLGPGS